MLLFLLFCGRKREGDEEDRGKMKGAVGMFIAIRICEVVEWKGGAIKVE